MLAADRLVARLGVERNRRRRRDSRSMIDAIPFLRHCALHEIDTKVTPRRAPIHESGFTICEDDSPRAWKGPVVRASAVYYETRERSTT